jgi:hypothetical protein
VQTIALSAELPGIYVSAAPTPLAFGYVAPGSSTTLPVTLTNGSLPSNSAGFGSTVAITSSLASSNPAFSATLGTCSAPLAAGATGCKIQVTVNSAAAQSYSGNITWTEQITGGGPSQQMTLPVTATGINPVVVLPPDSETIHITDQLALTPSTLLPGVEAIHIADQLSLVSSTLLPINETIHISDNIQRPLGSAPVTPTITWPQPAAITYGTALGSAQLNATASAAGTFAYSPAAGAVPGAGTRQLSVTFTPTDTADYASATAMVSLSVLPVPLTVTIASASRAFATANPAFSYSIGGYVNGDTSAAVSGAPVLSTTAVLHSPAGSYAINGTTGTLSAANYSFAFVPGTLTVLGNAPRHIVFHPIPNVPLAIGKLTLTAYSTAGGLGQPIVYTVTGPASVSGSILVLQGPGQVKVTASQAGNTTFAPATPVSQTFTVTP